ncbi:activating signal cointegrator 1 [Coccinella septempunctata]|uniref:activating signal cointegrator 1 n=1 Tax=Coccinella septempunctata TaxID=41139 RepID=UPI001D08C4F7|nr:activating signal cointegrator 1 [Coccinella septempunctata]
MENHKHQIKKHLTTILTYEPEENILDYLLGIKTEADFEDFTHDIMDLQNTAHQRAYNAIRDILFRNKNVKPNNKNNSGNSKVKVDLIQRERAPEHSIGKNKNVSKGKKKFQDIKQFKEKEKIKKGRTECNCQGQEHGFMNNCLNCGRIHCLEEGPGPCFFCGNYLSESGRNEISANFAPKENKIYDDDNDYFKIKRDENKKKKSMVIALDFATRRVIESTEEDERLRKKMLEDCKKHLKNVEQLFKNLQKSSEYKPVANLHEEMVNLLLRMRHAKPAGIEPDLEKEDSLMPDLTFKTKLFSEGFDQGLCLSMHQPYASLLIAGVKKHEGRNWPTNHRGILWIAAAAHKPEPEEISDVEKFYREYYNDPSLKFPTSYPTSCLLGCVEVEDCLNQEVYRKQYPVGESGSPFVLICENPIILPIFYPIVGQHKIYPLDKDLHKCAKMCLRFANLMDG